MSLAVHINCFACASRFLSVIAACSRPYLRRQLSGHTIDTMLFACPLSMHSPSLCIKGHVPTSYCISTGPSTLLRMSCKMQFSVLFIKQKFISIKRFIAPDLVNLRSLITISYKLSEIREPENAKIYKEMYERGQP